MNKQQRSIISNDTIVAPATPPGKGGVGIVRVSGANAKHIAETICNKELTNRYAHFATFFDKDKNPIDEGIALFFQKPHSFTGEDVFEMQVHGSVFVIDILLKEACRIGARLAKPGEFSERAFLNNKLDLSQAEAISDLINSTSEQAARNALNSLQGVFSKKVNNLQNELINLRMHIEATIDFSEEEIDFLTDHHICKHTNDLISNLEQLINTANQGVIIQEGITVVIAGKPNAGKSCLMNQLTESDTAIATEIAGTTRDTIKETIQIDGLPLHIIDTAGLRETDDIIEKIGIEKTYNEIKKAGYLLLIIDSITDSLDSVESFISEISDYLGIELSSKKIIIVYNKIDLTHLKPTVYKINNNHVVNISAKNGCGIDILKNYLKKVIGYQQSEGTFTARRRHLEALKQTLQHIKEGKVAIQELSSIEIMAEQLRIAQNELSKITGEYTNEDLLGDIFSNFCIGK